MDSVFRLAKMLKSKPVDISGVTVVPSIAEYVDPLSFAVQPVRGLSGPDFNVYYDGKSTHIDIVDDSGDARPFAVIDNAAPIYYSRNGRGGVAFVSSDEISGPTSECNKLEDLPSIVNGIKPSKVYCVDLGEDPEKHDYMVVLYKNGFTVEMPDRVAEIIENLKYEYATPIVQVSNSGVKVYEQRHGLSILGRIMDVKPVTEKDMVGLTYAVLGSNILFGYGVEPMLNARRKS